LSVSASQKGFGRLPAMVVSNMVPPRGHDTRAPSVLEDFAPARRLGLRLFSRQLPAR
jgi:hypothetical protein